MKFNKLEDYIITGLVVILLLMVKCNSSSKKVPFVTLDRTVANKYIVKKIENFDGISKYYAKRKCGDGYDYKRNIYFVDENGAYHVNDTLDIDIKILNKK